MKTFIWVGIIFSIFQSAMLSGLNFAVLSIRKRRFEIESKKNDAHVLKDASGAAIPTYENAGSARKKILFPSIAVFVGVAVVLGLTGCSSRTPNIYKMDPENAERIRSDVGRVGAEQEVFLVDRHWRPAPRAAPAS